jgi:3-methyladenine DNA glycosylase AlkD
LIERNNILTYQEVIKELESLRNERGINNYEKTYGKEYQYLGLGLTQLRKTAKKIKIDTDLAKKLQKSKYFEAKMVGIMVDDPKLFNQKKLESFLEKLPKKINENPLSYFTMILSEYIVAKSPDVKEVILKFSKSKNSSKRFIAYSSLANLGRIKSADDNYFEKFLPIIVSALQKEDNNVKDAMHNSLLSWGQRNKHLNAKIIESLKLIGKVNVDYGDTSCKTPDASKILNSERIQKKIS